MFYLNLHQNKTDYILNKAQGTKDAAQCFILIAFSI